MSALPPLEIGLLNNMPDAALRATEQQFAGGNDPDNREDLFAGNPITGYTTFDTEQPQFKLIASLIQMRKDHEALRRGDVSITWSVEVAGVRRDEGIFGVDRLRGAHGFKILSTDATGLDVAGPLRAALGGA